MTAMTPDVHKTVQTTSFLTFFCFTCMYIGRNVLLYCLYVFYAMTFHQKNAVVRLNRKISHIYIVHVYIIQTVQSLGI